MVRLLKPITLTLAVLNLLDMAITACLLARFGTAAEANLLMRAMWQASPVLFVAFKALLSTVFLILASKADWLRRWMVFAVMPATAIYLVVVGWGVYVLVNML